MMKLAAAPGAGAAALLPVMGLWACGSGKAESFARPVWRGLVLAT
jgi:hypothetical protein